MKLVDCWSKLTKSVFVLAFCALFLRLVAERYLHVQAWTISSSIQPSTINTTVQARVNQAHKYAKDESDKNSRSKTQPHILLIVADDYGFHDIGYHGSDIKTPNLDKLALSGVRLENYYVQKICTPSRGQLLTGRYQIHTGLQYLIQPGEPYGLSLDNPTIADKLKEAGYHTHMVGKWHVGHYKKEYLPTYRGFDSFFGFLSGSEDYYMHSIDNYMKIRGIDLHENDKPADIAKYVGRYSTTLFEEKAKDIIQHHDATKPLFLYLPFQAVHGPLQVPDIYVNQNKNINTTINDMIYAGMVTCMDEAVGNVVDAMKQRGMWDNTVLIFTTDNGGSIIKGASNQPLRGGKGSLWEGGIRAIGFVHSRLIDDRVAGSVSNELMHVTDWFPTLITLAGGNINGTKPLDGYDQWNTIKNGARSRRTEILHHIDPRRNDPSKVLYNITFNTDIEAALRMGDWKLITGYPVRRWNTLNCGQSNRHIHEFSRLWLFDIAKDPSECFDVSDKFPEIIKRMLHRLGEYQKTMVPTPPLQIDPQASPALHNGFVVPWR